MPIVTMCPYCGHFGRLHERFQGKHIKCPQCEMTFLTATPSETRASGQPPMSTVVSTTEEAVPFWSGEEAGEQPRVAARGGEPWYYRFLVFYAWLVLLLAVPVYVL